MRSARCAIVREREKRKREREEKEREKGEKERREKRRRGFGPRLAVRLNGFSWKFL